MYKLKEVFKLILFNRTKDCIHVLIMDKPDLRQLSTDLNFLNAKEQKNILQEYRISLLSGRETETLIKKRTDLSR